MWNSLPPSRVMATRTDGFEGQIRKIHGPSGYVLYDASITASNVRSTLPIRTRFAGELAEWESRAVFLQGLWASQRHLLGHL